MMYAQGVRPLLETAVIFCQTAATVSLLFYRLSIFFKETVTFAEVRSIE